MSLQETWTEFTSLQNVKWIYYNIKSDKYYHLWGQNTKLHFFIQNVGLYWILNKTT